MKILVTGANGMLGSNLCVMYAKMHEVIATDRVLPDFQNCSNIKLDITSDHDLKALSMLNPDLVVNCAALVNVDFCEDHPEEALDINCSGAAKLAKEIAESLGKGCYFVHVSSDSVFDGAEGNYHEGSETNPLNAYGRSKLCAERAVAKSCGRNSDFAIIRTNIIGWSRQGRRSLAEWMLLRLENGEDLPAFADVFFSPILVNNLAEVILELAAIRYLGLLHVAGDDGCSKLEFARMLAGTFGLDTRTIRPALMDELPLKAKRGRNMVLDVSKARRMLEAKMLPVRDGLELLKKLKHNGFLEELRQKRGVRR